jgi:hypothetical protein
MTQDAIDEANSLRAAITALVNEKTNAIAQVPRSLPSLSSDQRSEIVTNLGTMYDALITVQQIAFTALSGDYIQS